MLCQVCAVFLLGLFFIFFHQSEEFLKGSFIYLVYGQFAGCEKPICLYIDNFIAFQTVIQELWIVCDDKSERASR